MESDTRDILLAAIQAPSGENVQPWRFHVSGGTIDLHHANVDSEIYDTGSRGSYVSHGAAIENMVIEARAKGYQTNVQLFPNSYDDTHVARITLGSKGESSAADAKLAAIIPQRMTNRNKYEKKPLSEESIAALTAAADAIEGVEYLRYTERDTIEKLARVGSVNEEVMLQNQQLHEFFFSHVTWTKEEDAQKRVGFYIKTLGLPTPVQALFRLFRNWSVMSLLKKIGFPTVVGKGNTETYAASAEIGMLRISEDTPEEFVRAGRALQRIWLTATQQGVSLQPLAGTLFMNYYAATEKSKDVFSMHERELIEGAKATAYSGMSKDGIIAFMFRLGYGNPPEAHASRFELEHFLI